MKKIGFNDEYMPNYFIRRLVGYSMKSAKNIQEFEKSKYCLQSSLICHEKDSLNILSNIFSVSFHRFNVNAMSISKNQLQIF